jgi:RimJ/RimL family protein N-acetyltransferase
MVEVLADRTAYAYTGGEPPDREALRRRYERLSVGRSGDGAWAWHNWIIRRVTDGRAVGTVQATVSLAQPEAEVAWIVGLPWQGHGFATEAARRLVAWLEAEGVGTIVAHIHPDHAASTAVATRLGMRPTEVFVDGERAWRRGRLASPRCQAAADMDVAGLRSPGDVDRRRPARRHPAGPGSR